MSTDENRNRRIDHFLSLPGNTEISTREAARQLGIPESTLRCYKARKSMTTLQKLSIADITTDLRLQLRVDLDRLQVETYADAIRDGKYLPPVKVVSDGQAHWLADGYQRYAAHKLAERDEIECEVSAGDFRAALLLACSANSEHGVNRSNADKRNAIRTMLADETWGQWSSPRIAAACGLSKGASELVDSIRDGIDKENGIDIYAVTRTRIAERAGGKEYEIKIAPKPRPITDFAPHVSELQATVAPAIQDIPISPVTTERKQDIPQTHPTEPEDSTPSTPNGLAPRVQSDDEYLESIEVRKKLSEPCRQRFDHDALLYRRLVKHDAFKAFADLIQRHINPPGGVAMGPYCRSIRRPMVILPPHNWLFCGLCDGTGFAETASCGTCGGNGYKIKGA